MANDVQPISGEMLDGARPLIAARLCNFGTGDARPITAHKQWISGPVRDLLTKSPNPWIDVYAYASKKGTSRGYDNLGLSRMRRDAIKKEIAAASSKANFIQQLAFGSSRSTGNAENDDGYWRAVEVYVFGSLPPGRKPEPTPKPTPAPSLLDEWYVTNLSLTGGTIVAGVGGGAFVGKIDFEHFSNSGRQKVPANIGMVGVAAGLSLGIPGLKDNTLFKSALKFILDNGGFSHMELPSGTIGMCFPNKRKRTKLVSTDFFGPCVTHFLSGNAAVGSFGAWAVYFGLPTDHDWLTYIVAHPLIVGELCKGIAIISNGGIGVSASLGASVNDFAGEIA